MQCIKSEEQMKLLHSGYTLKIKINSENLIQAYNLASNSGTDLENPRTDEDTYILEMFRSHNGLLNKWRNRFIECKDIEDCTFLVSLTKDLNYKVCILFRNHLQSGLTGGITISRISAELENIQFLTFMIFMHSYGSKLLRPK